MTELSNGQGLSESETSSQGYEFCLFGSRWLLRGEPSLMAHMIGAFINAYKSGQEEQQLYLGEDMDVLLEFSEELSPQKEHLTRTTFHMATSFPWWNIEAYADNISDPFTVCQIPRHGIEVRRISKNSLKITRIKDHAVLANEQLFTVIRNLSLYQRKPKVPSALVHSSGVVFDDRAMLFIGPSMSGKTTCFIEATLRGAGTPFCNDRCLVLFANSTAYAESWPSYITLMEGTILNYSPLKNADSEYNRGEYQFATHRWDEPPKSIFGKLNKRLYPMEWYSQLMGKKYIKWARPKWLIFPSIRADIKGCTIQQLNADHQDEFSILVGLLGAQLYGPVDSGFPQWHNIQRNTSNDIEASDMLRYCHLSGVTFWRLECGYEDIELITERLDAIRESST